MRFTTVSVALLALAHSLASVHGAPVVASNHMNALAVRQTLSPLGGLLGTFSSLITTLEGLLGTTLPPQVVQEIDQLKSALAGVTTLLPRALPSSPNAPFPASSAPSTINSTTTTTTSIGLATGNVSSASLGTPRASSTPLTRMRRQIPTSLPIPTPPARPSTVSSRSAPLSTQSALASAPSATSGTPVASRPATIKPTSSNPSPSASQGR